MCKLLLISLSFFALVSGCSLFNPNEKDSSKISSLPKVQNHFDPIIIWSTSFEERGGNFYSDLHPAFYRNLAYVANRKGIVSAFKLDDGQPVWSINLEKKTSLFSSISALLSGGLTVSAKQIYVGSEKAQVYALNTNDGSIIWKTCVDGEVLASPRASDGIVLIHTGKGMLQALNEVDGTIKWTVNLATPSFSFRGKSRPEVAFGVAIVGDDNGCVSAILLEKGQVIWQQTISEDTGVTEIERLKDINSSPVISDGIVYAVGYNSNLAALNFENGEIIWKRKISSLSDFIVHEKRIYLVDQDDRLLAMSTDNGMILWTQSQLLHRSLTAPSLYHGNLVVGDSKGYIHWIDTETGHFIAQKRVSDVSFLTMPIIAGDKLLIQDRESKLYAITH